MKYFEKSQVNKDKNALSERISAHYFSSGRCSIEFMTQSRLWPPKERPGTRALSYFLWMQWRYLLRSYKKVLISVSLRLYFFPFDMLTRLLGKTRNQKRVKLNQSLKTNEIFVRISALASKKGQIKTVV